MFYQSLDQDHFVELCTKDFDKAKQLVRFKEIQKCMKKLDWGWARVDGCNPPTIKEMKRQVDELFGNMIENIKEEFPQLGRHYCATGGFHVELCLVRPSIGKDDPASWSVRIFFNFDDAESEEWVS